MVLDPKGILTSTEPTCRVFESKTLSLQYYVLLKTIMSTGFKTHVLKGTIDLVCSLTTI